VKEFSKDTLDVRPNLNAPAEAMAQVNADVKTAPVDLESVVKLAKRLTAESRPAGAMTNDGGTVTDDPRVALLVTKEAIHTISDLMGKSIAVDSSLSESDAAIRIALVAAGAPEIQIADDRTSPLDRMRRGEVPGAVIGLLLRDRLHDMPEIDGYRFFEVPLSPN
jgi:hypothetical protein